MIQVFPHVAHMVGSIYDRFFSRQPLVKPYWLAQHIKTFFKKNIS
jgi:hypothetical protein